MELPARPGRGRRGSSILAGTVAATSVTTAHQAPAMSSVAGLLGLPPISSAQSFNLAPGDLVCVGLAALGDPTSGALKVLVDCS